MLPSVHFAVEVFLPPQDHAGLANAGVLSSLRTTEGRAFGAASKVGEFRAG